MKKITLPLAIFTLATSLLTHAENITCPTLTAKDVENVINNGTILNEQDYTLAVEAGETPAQVLLNEPTANPFDTYYSVSKSIHFNNKPFFVMIGNVLGKADYEAKTRAKQILLSDEKIFNAVSDSESRTCEYKSVHASPSIENYPFISQYEDVELIGTYIVDDASENLAMRRLKAKFKK